MVRRQRQRHQASIAPARRHVSCPSPMSASVEQEIRLGQQLFLAGRRERDRRAAGRWSRTRRLGGCARRGWQGRRWRRPAMSERTARRRQREALPSAAKAARPWRTREGQLADVPRMRRGRRPGVHNMPGRSAAPAAPRSARRRRIFDPGSGRLAAIIRLAAAKASPAPVRHPALLCVSSGKARGRQSATGLSPRFGCALLQSGRRCLQQGTAADRRAEVGAQNGVIGDAACARR